MSPSTQPARRRTRIALGVVALLAVLFLQLALSANRNSITWDEDDHIYAGYMSWKHGDFGLNPEHPPLVKLVAALPLLDDAAQNACVAGPLFQTRGFSRRQGFLFQERRECHAVSRAHGRYVFHTLAGPARIPGCSGNVRDRRRVHRARLTGVRSEPSGTRRGRGNGCWTFLLHVRVGLRFLSLCEGAICLASHRGRNRHRPRSRVQTYRHPRLSHAVSSGNLGSVARGSGYRIECGDNLSIEASSPPRPRAARHHSHWSHDSLDRLRIPLSGTR